MNHISKSYTSGEGRVYKSHSWELREGGFRRSVLIVGNGLWPVQKEERLVNFLMDRGFRVLSLEAAYGTPELPRLRLRSFTGALVGFAKQASPEGLPLYLLASSFSASALLPASAEIPGLAALALVSPIVDFSAPKFKMPFFFSTAELAIKKEQLSGMPELLAVCRDLDACESEQFHIKPGPFRLPLVPCFRG